MPPQQSLSPFTKQTARSGIYKPLWLHFVRAAPFSHWGIFSDYLCVLAHWAPSVPLDCKLSRESPPAFSDISGYRAQQALTEVLPWCPQST